MWKEAAVAIRQCILFPLLLVDVQIMLMHSKVLSTGPELLTASAFAPPVEILPIVVPVTGFNLSIFLVPGSLLVIVGIVGSSLFGD